MNLTVMNKCEKRFGFIKFDEMTRVKVLLLAVNSKRRKHLNSEDSEARFKVWYTFRTLSGDSGITVWSFEDRSSVPGPERWGLCNVKFHQNGDTVPLTLQVALEHHFPPKMLHSDIIYPIVYNLYHCFLPTTEYCRLK